MQAVNQSVTYGKAPQAMLKDPLLNSNINLPFCKQPFTGHLTASVQSDDGERSFLLIWSIVCPPFLGAELA